MMSYVCALYIYNNVWLAAVSRFFCALTGRGGGAVGVPGREFFAFETKKWLILLLMRTESLTFVADLFRLRRKGKVFCRNVQIFSGGNVPESEPES